MISLGEDVFDFSGILDAFSSKAEMSWNISYMEQVALTGTPEARFPGRRKFDGDNKPLHRGDKQNLDWFVFLNFLRGQAGLEVQRGRLDQKGLEGRGSRRTSVTRRGAMGP